MIKLHLILLVFAFSSCVKSQQNAMKGSNHIISGYNSLNNGIDMIS